MPFLQIFLIMTGLDLVLLRTGGWALDYNLPKGWMAWTSDGWM